jgi:hypothetical protein
MARGSVQGCIKLRWGRLAEAVKKLPDSENRENALRISEEIRWFFAIAEDQIQFFHSFAEASAPVQTRAFRRNAPARLGPNRELDAFLR